MLLVWAASGFAVAAPACGPTGPELEATAPASLEDTVRALLTGHQVPGLALAVVRDGALRWSGGYGVRDAGAGAPVSPETVFEAASLSKPVFAYLVLALSREGVIALDRPLAEHLPALEREEGDTGTLTPRHILSHTAGLPPWPAGTEIHLESEPGTAWRYSGGGYVLLQRAVEAATGEPLETLAARLVFEPLGMTRSGFGWHEAFGTDAAVPHDSAGHPLRPVRFDREAVDRMGAASGLYTTATDFARFMTAVLAAADEPWLRPMFETQVTVDPGLGLGWGVGWALQHEVGIQRAFHWGANPGFRALALMHPRTGSGWVALTNGPLGLELMDELSGVLTGSTPTLFRFYMLHPTD